MFLCIQTPMSLVAMLSNTMHVRRCKSITTGPYFKLEVVQIILAHAALAQCSLGRRVWVAGILDFLGVLLDKHSGSLHV